MIRRLVNRGIFFNIRIPNYFRFHNIISDQNTKADINQGEQQYFNIQKTNGEIDENQFNRIIKQLSQNNLSKFTIQKNITFISKSLKNMNVDDISIHTSMNLSAIVTNLIQLPFIDYVFLNNLLKKAKIAIQKNQPSEYNNSRLIKFYKISVQIHELQCCQVFCQKIMQGCQILTKKQILQYFQIISERILPKKIQKSLFKMIQNVCIENIQLFQVSQLVELYGNIICLNHSAFDTKILNSLIQKKLWVQIEQMSFEDIRIFAKFAHFKNKFLPSMLNQIFSKIDQNGNSDIKSSDLMQTIIQACDYEHFQLKKIDESKFFKFILNNLRKICDFLPILIRKKFLSKNQIRQFHNLLSNQRQNWLNILPATYLYQINFLNLVSQKDMRFLIQSHQKVQISLKDNQMAFFVLFCGQHKKQKLDQFISQNITVFQDNFKLKQIINTNYSKLIKDFHQIYNKICLFQGGRIYQSNFSSNPLFIIEYFILSNQLQMFKAMSKSNQRFSRAVTFRPLINKINSNPVKYINRFQVINKMLMPFAGSSDIRFHMIQYFCNWKIHMLMTKDEINSFLQLLISFMKNMSIKPHGQFISYFVQSPDKILKTKKQYLEFLKLIESAEVQLMKKSKDYRFYNQTAIELTKFNSMSEEYAKFLSTFVNNSILQMYIRVILKLQIDLEQIHVNKTNVFILLRSTQISRSTIQIKQKNILDSLYQSSLYSLQKNIINFSWTVEKNGPNIGSIYNYMLERYIKKTKQVQTQQQSRYFKIFFVIQALTKNSYKTEYYYETFLKIIIAFVEQYKIQYSNEIMEMIKKQIQQNPKIDENKYFTQIKKPQQNDI